MKILHGTWIPDHNNGFIQTESFYVWVETATTAAIASTKRKSTKAAKVSEGLLPKHPASLTESDLKLFLYNDKFKQLIALNKNAILD
jgi:hypothetical protein